MGGSVGHDHHHQRHTHCWVEAQKRRSVGLNSVGRHAMVRHWGLRLCSSQPELYCRLYYLAQAARRRGGVHLGRLHRWDGHMGHGHSAQRRDHSLVVEVAADSLVVVAGVLHGHNGQVVGSGLAVHRAAVAHLEERHLVEHHMVTAGDSLLADILEGRLQVALHSTPVVVRRVAHLPVGNLKGSQGAGNLQGSQGLEGSPAVEGRLLP